MRRAAEVLDNSQVAQVSVASLVQVALGAAPLAASWSRSRLASTSPAQEPQAADLGWPTARLRASITSFVNEDSGSIWLMKLQGLNEIMHAKRT